MKVSYLLTIDQITCRDNKATPIWCGLKSMILSRQTPLDCTPFSLVHLFQNYIQSVIVHYISLMDRIGIINKISHLWPINKWISSNLQTYSANLYVVLIFFGMLVAYFKLRVCFVSFHVREVRYYKKLLALCLCSVEAYNHTKVWKKVHYPKLMYQVS